MAGPRCESVHLFPIRCQQAAALKGDRRPGPRSQEIYRKLDSIRTRRMPKVWLHVALSILVLNGSAVARIQEGRPDQLRECVRKVA